MLLSVRPHRRKAAAMLPHTLMILAADPETQRPGFDPILMVLPVLAVLFYFIVLRPGQRRQQQERDALVTGLKKNDKVITTAGIYGTVISVSEKEDEVVVKVDDNTRLKMLKSSIMKNLTNEEAAKAAKDTKDNSKKDAVKEAAQEAPGIRKA
jgi:preprotein translocase subunit YajC